MPTLPVDHDWLAAHFTALTTSACSPGPGPVQAPVRPAEPAQVDHHEAVALLQQARALDEVLEALRRPAFGPTGSYWVPSAGPAGPVWPEWLKYGPIETMTGVLVASVAPLGRSTSACSVTPSEDGIHASDQSASDTPRRRPRPRRARRRAQQRKVRGQAGDGAWILQTQAVRKACGGAIAGPAR